MIDHSIFLEKWHNLLSEEEQEEAMKNYMFSLSYDELTRFINWGTDMEAFRAAQERGEFSAESRRKLLKEVDERITAKQKLKEIRVHSL